MHEKNNVGIRGASAHSLQLYRTQGLYAQAALFYERSLAIMEKALGPNHPDMAASLENLAQFYWKTGREKTAEELEKRAAVIRAMKR